MNNDIAITIFGSCGISNARLTMQCYTINLGVTRRRAAEIDEVILSIAAVLGLNLDVHVIAIELAEV